MRSVNARYFGWTLLLIIFCSGHLISETAVSSEADLKKQADKLFSAENYEAALPDYSRLLSLYPSEPVYNYRFGVCLLLAGKEKTNASNFLEIASKDPKAPDEVWYYLGKSYMINNDFSKAQESFMKFKSNASESKQKKFDLDAALLNCKSGSELNKSRKNIVISGSSEVPLNGFYNSYDFSASPGKIVNAAEEFLTDLDKSKKKDPVMYIGNDKQTILFASYGKKGENGKDIYIIRKTPTNEWSKPENLGYPVNSSSDEDYPFLARDGRTMYFSSKGHNSIGGYDIFKTVYDFNTGRWSEPENMGIPINTIGDDILFVPDEKNHEAIYSTDIESGKNNVSIRKIQLPSGFEDMVTISGVYIPLDQKVRRDARISVLTNSGDGIITTVHTDPSTGKYELVLPPGESYMIVVEGGGYLPHKEVFDLPAGMVNPDLRQVVKINKEEEKEELTLQNYFSSDNSADEPSSSVTHTYSTTAVDTSEMVGVKINDQVVYVTPPSVDKSKSGKEIKTPSENESTKNGNTVEGNTGISQADSNNLPSIKITRKDKFDPTLDQGQTPVEKMQEQEETARQKEIDDDESKPQNTIDADVSNEELAKMAYSDAQEIQDEADSLKRESDALRNKATEKQNQSADLKTKAETNGLDTDSSLALKTQSDLDHAEAEDNIKRADELSALSSAKETEAHAAVAEANEIFHSSKASGPLASNNKKPAAVSKNKNINGGVNKPSINPDTSGKIVNGNPESTTAKNNKEEEKIPLQEEPENKPVAVINSTEDKTSKNDTTLVANDQKHSDEIKPVEKDTLAGKTVTVESSEKNSSATAVNEGKINNADTLKSASSSEVKVEQNPVVNDVAKKSENPSGNTNDIDTIINPLPTPLNDKTSQDQGSELSVENKKEDTINTSADTISKNIYNPPVQRHFKMPEVFKNVNSDTLKQNSAEVTNENVGDKSTSNEKSSSKENDSTSSVIIPKPANINEQPLADSLPNDAGVSVKTKPVNENTKPAMDSIRKDAGVAVITKPKTESAKPATVSIEKDTNVAGNTKPETEIVKPPSESIPMDAGVSVITKPANVTAKPATENIQKDTGIAAKTEAANENTKQSDDNNQKDTNISVLTKPANENVKETTDSIHQDAAVAIKTEPAHVNSKDSAEDTQQDGSVAIISKPTTENAQPARDSIPVNAKEYVNYKPKPVDDKAKNIYREYKLKLDTSNDLLKSSLALQDQISHLKSSPKRDKLIKQTNDLTHESSKKWKEALGLINEARAIDPEIEYKMEANDYLEMINNSGRLASDNDSSDATVMRKLDSASRSQSIVTTVDGNKSKGQVKKGMNTEANVKPVVSPSHKKNTDKTEYVAPEEQSEADLDTTHVDYPQYVKIKKEITSKQVETIDVFADAINISKKAQDEREKSDALLDQAQLENDSVKKKALVKQSFEIKAQAEKDEKSAKEKFDIAQKNANVVKGLRTDLVAVREKIKRQPEQNNETASTGVKPLENKTSLPANKKTTGAIIGKNDKRLNSNKKSDASGAGQTLAMADNENADLNASESDISSVSVTDEETEDFKRDVFDNNSSTSYSEKNPIPINPVLPDGLVFKVQIGAFHKPLPSGAFKGLQPVSGETTRPGWIRYCVGLFKAFEPANIVKKEVQKDGYRDAYVVAYYNGKRIELNEAYKKVKANENLTAYKNESSKEIALLRKLNIHAETASSVSADKDERSFYGQQLLSSESSSISSSSGQVEYAVQVGVYRNPAPPSVLASLQPLQTEEINSHLYRFISGKYADKASAETAKLNAINSGVKDAFIVIYRKGTTVESSDIPATVAPKKESINPTPTSTEKIENNNPDTSMSGIIYKVQIGAYKNNVPYDKIESYLAISDKGITQETDERNLHIFYAGNCKTLSEATSLRDEIVRKGVKDAFVVALRGKEKVK